MYGFEPTQEQSMLVQSVRRFAIDALQPAAHDADESGELPAHLVEQGWALGLVQAGVDDAYGGLGERSALTNVLAMEELGCGDAAAALAIMAPGLFATPVSQCGSQQQKEQWLSPLVNGGWQPYSAAWIEPRSNFSLDQIELRATPDNGLFRLNGQKSYVPFADRAPAMLVLARVDHGPAWFIVEAGLDGVRVGERERLLGLHGLPMYPVEFDQAAVRSDNLLQVSDEAFGRLRASTYLGSAAVALGLSRAAYEYAREYAKDRVAFGEPIAHKQSIAFMLAEMAIEIEAIRLLVWEAAWLLDTERPAERAAYMAHQGASDMAMMVTDRAVQILGGHGYIRDHPVERWMRNGRGVAVMPGLVTV